jgi:tetratricopeptide (TPR) repeat protein
MANSHLKLAEALLDQGNPLLALSHDRKAMAILTGMGSGSRNANILRMLVRSRMAAGDTESKMNQPAYAAADYTAASDLAAQLVKADPGQAFARTELARSQLGLAECQTQLGDWGDARDHFRQALENWTVLRNAKALAPEDALNVDRAARGLKAAVSKIGSTGSEH